MPPELKLQAIGLTIYPHHYGRPIRNIDEIASNLNAMGRVSYWLEEYHPTFRTTKIRIRSIVKHQPDHELVCTSTIRIELPIENGWVGIISVKQHADELYELSDNANNVLVFAGSVSLHTVART